MKSVKGTTRHFTEEETKTAKNVQGSLYLVSKSSLTPLLEKCKEEPHEMPFKAHQTSKIKNG